jgi:hypothetical protein
MIRNWRLSILRRQLANLELHSLHYPVRDRTWWNMLGMAERVRRQIAVLETIET